MLGHNNGPPIGDITDVGGLMRQYAWRKAHKKAWRTPPIEIVKLRHRAATQIGLSYRDYTAILMDRGHRPSAVFFDLGGTLVRTRNNDIDIDRYGAATLMPGVRKKLQALSDCKLFVIAESARPAETLTACIAQLNELCAGKIIDHLTRGKPATDMVNHLLTKHAIPPSQAILVGATVESERCAEQAKLARFFWAWTYFAETAMASA
jgi:beta-phosphoglucomutase-like phosphatase (HAD superfamily)